jgi:hypothetical protein
VQFGLLVESRAGRPLSRQLREAFAGALRFLHCLLPLAAQLHDLGSTHEALATVRDQVWLCVAPLAQRRRPFVCAPQIRDFVTGLNHTAVNVAGEHGRYLARRDCHHRLVQQRYARGDLAKPDQGAASAVPGECEEIRIAEALGDPVGFFESRVGSGRIFLDNKPNAVRHEHVPLLDAVLRVVVEQLASSGEPAARPGTLACVHEHEAEPESTADSEWDVGSA